MPRHNMSHLRRFCVKHIDVIHLETQHNGTLELWVWKGAMKNKGKKHRDGAFSADGFNFMARRWLYRQLHPPEHANKKKRTSEQIAEDNKIIYNPRRLTKARISSMKYALQDYEKEFGVPLTTDLYPDRLWQDPQRIVPNARETLSNRDWADSLNTPKGSGRRNRNKYPKFQSDLEDSRKRLSARERQSELPAGVKPETVGTRGHRVSYKEEKVEEFLEDRNSKPIRDIPLEYPQVKDRRKLVQLFIDGKTDEEVMELIRRGKLK